MRADPEKMDRASKTVYGLVYPFIARQILDRSAIRRGICVDVGTGPASLAIEIARASGLQVYAMDISPEQCRIARKNLGGEAMTDRVAIVTGDVHHLPFPDDSVDLAVSRGSVFFWEDLAKAFGEVYRALKPGGFGYIGGGLGNKEMKMKVRREPGYAELGGDQGRKKLQPGELIAALNAAGVNDYAVIDNDAGLWAIIKKPGVPQRAAGSMMTKRMPLE